MSLLSGYLLVVFIAAGLIAPWLWTAAQFLAAHWPASGVEALARHPFHRYVHRCLLVMSVIGLWPLARALGLRRAADFGLRVDAGASFAVRQALVGFAASTGMFVLALALEFGSGGRRWRGCPETAAIVHVLMQALLSGVAVGVLEEVVFRGVLCGGLRSGSRWGWPIAASSVVFALVHLFRRTGPPEGIGAGSGLATIGAMLAGWGDAERWLPGGVTLVLAGVLLGTWYRRTGNLYGPIGIHTGWVFWAKVRGLLTIDGGPVGGGGFERQVWDHGVMLGVMLVGLLVLWAIPLRTHPVSDGEG